VILSAIELAARLLAGEQASAADPLRIIPQPDLAFLQKSGAASVDLRLGTWFAAPRPSRTPVLDVGAGESDTIEPRLMKQSYVPFGEKFYLHPRSFVLAVTLEWVRLPADLACYVVGKSGWGRRGLIIATATGVHPTFSGCLTLELANVGEVPIAVYPGMHICQLFAHTVVGSTPSVEASMYVGFRRPVLGPLALDSYAQRLRGL
jgi:dCTP deaminase